MNRIEKLPVLNGEDQQFALLSKSMYAIDFSDKTNVFEFDGIAIDLTKGEPIDFKPQTWFARLNDDEVKFIWDTFKYDCSPQVDPEYNPNDFKHAFLKAIVAKDLDEACLHIQNALGQHDGGSAGIFFSGPHEGYEVEEQWNDIDDVTRRKILAEYVRFELLFEI